MNSRRKAPFLKAGDKVRIKKIEGITTIKDVLEYTKRPIRVISVADLGGFQGIELEGVPYLMTNHNVEKINED